ncbi:MAG: hypothetical protein GQ533_05700 [Methanosarcinaceae archaeon]|nr:hypothetical protein [Methanosarcinaceae archaeon]
MSPWGIGVLPPVGRFCRYFLASSTLDVGGYCECCWVLLAAGTAVEIYNLYHISIHQGFTCMSVVHTNK